MSKTNDTAALTETIEALRAEIANMKGGKVSEAPAKEITLTKEGSHVAVKRGYANGMLIEDGDAVPAGIPVGLWMKQAKKAKKPEAEEGEGDEA